MTSFCPTAGHQFGLLRLPDQIAFGYGTVSSIAEVAARLGNRAFICCDPHVVATPAFQDVERQLAAAGVSTEVWTEIVPELPVDSVERAADRARSIAPDLVIGFGGGSSIDLAKLVSLLLRHGGSLRQYYGENAVPGSVLPVVAVPTTSGTGSEVTPVAVVSDPDRALKVGVSSPYLIPRHAIVDPALAAGAPSAVVAHAGIDALVHAIEALTARRQPIGWAAQLPVFVGRNQLSSLLAAEAAATIITNLASAVRQPDDHSAREAMAYGSLLAGMAFGSAGTHLSHAIQYPVGALTKTPHGLGTGLLLPHVLRGCLPQIAPDLCELGGRLGLTEVNEATTPFQVITLIEQLNAGIGIPRTLQEIGIASEQLPGVVEMAGTITRLAGNAPVLADQIDGIVAAAWSGDRM